MKIVIIEDEPLTAKDLANTIVAVEPDATILSVLPSVEEALSFFKQKPDPDLIFSDIELGDGLSFDIFEKINNTTPIIFCTAFQQYSLEAFKTAGIDYVLKPFSKASIERTLSKYKTLQSRFNQPADFSTILNSLKNNLYGGYPSILVYQGDKIIPIEGSQIALLYIENESVLAYTFEQKKYLVNEKLEALEKIFAGTFFRANRQFLVSRKAVKDISHYFNRKMIVNLTIAFPHQIIVSRLRTAELIKWLGAH